MTEFGNAPVSLSEIRAAKAGDAALQTPRDALIMMLRDIDSGKVDTDLLIICYRLKKEGNVGSFYVAGGNSDPHMGIGLLESVKQIL